MLKLALSLRIGQMRCGESESNTRGIATNSTSIFISKEALYDQLQ